MKLTKGNLILRWMLASILLIGVILCILLLLELTRSNRIHFHASFGSWIVIFLMYSGTVFVNLHLWRLLVKETSAISVSMRESLLGLSALMIGKYVPGKVVGLVGRASTLSKRMPGPQAAVLAILEQSYLLAALALFSVVAASYLFNLGVLLFLLPLLTLSFFGGQRSLAWLLSKERFQQILRVREYRSFLIPSPMSTFKILALAIISTSSTIVVACIAPNVIGLEFDISTRFALAASYGIAFLTGMLSMIIPGGIGVREGVFFALANQWVGTENALALAALLRLINVGADLAVGSVGLILVRNGRGKLLPLK